MSKRIASCSCGQLTVAVAEDPIRVGVCHCLACQRRTGSAFGTQARFRKAGVEVKGESTQYVRIGDEGSKAIFSFCPVCGATVHYQTEGYEDTIAIPVGAFADPGFPEPTVSVYEEQNTPGLQCPSK